MKTAKKTNTLHAALNNNKRWDRVKNPDLDLRKYRVRPASVPQVHVVQF